MLAADSHWSLPLIVDVWDVGPGQRREWEHISTLKAADKMLQRIPIKQVSPPPSCLTVPPRSTPHNCGTIECCWFLKGVPGLKVLRGAPLRDGSV